MSDNKITTEQARIMIKGMNDCRRLLNRFVWGEHHMEYDDLARDLIRILSGDREIKFRWTIKAVLDKLAVCEAKDNVTGLVMGSNSLWEFLNVVDVVMEGCEEGNKILNEENLINNEAYMSGTR